MNSQYILLEHCTILQDPAGYKATVLSCMYKFDTQNLLIDNSKKPHNIGLKLAKVEKFKYV